MFQILSEHADETQTGVATRRLQVDKARFLSFSNSFPSEPRKHLALGQVVLCRLCYECASYSLINSGEKCDQAGAKANISQFWSNSPNIHELMAASAKSCFRLVFMDQLGGKAKCNLVRKCLTHNNLEKVICRA